MNQPKAIVAQSREVSPLPPTDPSVPDTDLTPLPPRQSRFLWLTPLEFLSVINAPLLAVWAMTMTTWLRPALVDSHRRGPKPVYPDSLILLIAFIQTAWQFSYEMMIDYLRARPQLAQFIGCPLDADGRVRVISVGQYWERRRALGTWPFLFFFIGMVWQLVKAGVIAGSDLVLDSSVLNAWFHDDPDAAWSFPKPWKGSTWGFKIHTLLCRWSSLPVMFLITPANRHDCLWAIPLLLATVACYGFQVRIVRADAAYFSVAILCFIRYVLHASFVIDYNLRRKGKKSVATLFFLDQWRFHCGFRTVIERHFAWAKRYFGLNSSHYQGWTAMTQHAALVYAVMLGVALAAERFGRPDLRLSRKGVLAAKTP